MGKNKIRILSTSQLDSMLIKKLEARDILCDVVPFIRISYPKDTVQELEIGKLFNEKIIAAFTSKHAIEAIRNIQGIQDAHWNIYCIGHSTAGLAAKTFPFASIPGTAENAVSLAHLMVKNEPGSKIYFFCGDLRRDELPTIAGKDLTIRELIVYTTQMTPVKTEGEYQGIIFLSPSAVKSFFTMNKPTPSTLLFAIGNTTAGEIKQFTENRIVIGNETSMESVVDKLIEEFQPVKSGDAN
jgi:uroporphyrinogen-III synthase